MFFSFVITGTICYDSFGDWKMPTAVLTTFFWRLSMYSKHTKDKLLGLIVACSALGMSQTADATVTSASSEGYVAYVDLNLLNLIPITLDKTPANISGVAPTPYQRETTTAVLDLSPLLKVNALSAKANSDVDGLAGNRTTNAFGGILTEPNEAGVHLNLLGLITLDLGAISAEASVTGDYRKNSDNTITNMTASGNSTVASLNGHILGIPIGLNVDPSIELNALGISIAFNEQIEDCDNPMFCSMEVNAIHINFDNVALNNLTAALLGIKTLTGDIILGHADAQMSAVFSEEGSVVPVPAAVWLFGTGIMGLVGFARRRQAQVIA